MIKFSVPVVVTGLVSVSALAAISGVGSTSLAEQAGQFRLAVQSVIPGTSQTVARPRVSAGPDVSVTLPESRVVLEGSSTHSRLLWSQVRGPVRIAFSDVSSARTQAALPVPGTYVLRLTALNDAGARIRSDDVVVRVGRNPIVIGPSSTPLDHLQSVNKPAFRNGHTLLPLTLSTCAYDSAIRLELVKTWGYGAQFSDGTDLENDRVMQAVRAEPGRYPVVMSQASIYRIMENHDGRHPYLPRLPDSTWMRDAQGNVILIAGRPQTSPTAPDSAFTQVGEFLGETARRIEDAAGQPIRLITNEAEAGLGITGDRDAASYWGQDPQAAAAFDAWGGGDWLWFISMNKARHERLIKEGMFSRLARGRPVYSLYGEGFNPERGRWAGWSWWMSRWHHFLDAAGRPTVSDYTSPQMYYRFQNTGWTGVHPQQGIPYDALTGALRDAGGAISLGQRNIYPWVSMGWEGDDSAGISSDDLFVGAMKAYYTAGALGAASGYFNCSGPIYGAMRLNTAIGAERPTPIRNVHLLAEVHALFTHLEPFLREGDLLPGTEDHPYRAFSETTPAMEFNAVGEMGPATSNAGTSQVRTARVLARKMRNQDRWLITAWANTGQDRDVRVTIDPRLGELTLRARRAGSVYIATLNAAGTPVLTLIDRNGMSPTADLFP